MTSETTAQEIVKSCVIAGLAGIVIGAAVPGLKAVNALAGGLIGCATFGGQTLYGIWTQNDTVEVYAPPEAATGAPTTDVAKWLTCTTTRQWTIDNQRQIKYRLLDGSIGQLRKCVPWLQNMK